MAYLSRNTAQGVELTLLSDVDANERLESEKDVAYRGIGKDVKEANANIYAHAKASKIEITQALMTAYAQMYDAVHVEMAKSGK